MWRSVIPKLGVVVVETCLKLQACLPVFVGGNCCSLINFFIVKWANFNALLGLCSEDRGERN